MGAAPDEPFDEMMRAGRREGSERTTAPPDDTQVRVPDDTSLANDVVAADTRPEPPPRPGPVLRHLRSEPATDPEARLPLDAEFPFGLEVTLDGGAQAWVRVGRRSVTVGRSMGGLQLNDASVSEGHASFAVRNGRLMMADGGSPSGVFIAAPPRLVVAAGSTFACGQHLFRYTGPLAPGPWPDFYGAPLPREGHRAEHVLVGNRSGQAVVFKSSLIIGRHHGQFRFPDDETVAPVHAELRPGPEGMELLTHARGQPVFVRLPAEREVPLGPGTLLRIGSSALRVTALGR